MTHFLTLQSVDDILKKISLFEPVSTETLPLEACSGRTLAHALVAEEDLPGFVRATMDGFAVRAKDVFGASEGMPALLDCIGECPMGETPSFSLKPGQTARIWTGGMLPEGADAVVMLEYSRDAGNNQMELIRPAAPFDNVVAADEDAQKGEKILPSGRVLRPQEIGLLAALGHVAATIRRKPKIAVISSGDEVVPPGDAPKPGQVRDVNAYSLSAFVEKSGGESRILGIARDSEEHLGVLICEALTWADVVLVSGGSSAGRRDYTINAFSAVADTEILARGVAISPGKPLIMTKKGNQSLWGLPGHAASALVCAEVFIRPLIARLLGQSGEDARLGLFKAVLSRSVASAQGRRDYIRVRLSPSENADDPPLATPVMGKSGLITTLVAADALIVCPEDEEGLEEGRTVDIRLLL